MFFVLEFYFIKVLFTSTLRHGVRKVQQLQCAMLPSGGRKANVASSFCIWVYVACERHS